MALLVVELTRQELADFALGHVRDPRGDQLDGAQLVVDALAHAVADLLAPHDGRRLGVEAHVAAAPEGRVLVGELPDEVARSRHGFVKTIGPKKDSAAEFVSAEPIEYERAPGLSRGAAYSVAWASLALR